MPPSRPGGVYSERPPGVERRAPSPNSQYVAVAFSVVSLVDSCYGWEAADLLPSAVSLGGTRWRLS